MQVPRPTRGDTRPDSMPNVRFTNYADASHFGADQYRDIARLGGALQNAGLSVLDEAQKRQRECDEMMVTCAVNELHSRMDEETRAIYEKYQGMDSTKIPEEARKAFQRVQAEIGGRLGTRKQREGYGRACAAYAPKLDRQNYKTMDARVAQTTATAQAAQNTQVTREAANVVGEAGGFNDVRSLHDVVMLNTAGKYRNLPEDLRQVELDKASRNFHKEMLSSINTMRGPQAALEYLKDQDVRKVYTPAELKEQTEKYRAEAAEIEDDEHAKQLTLDATSDALDPAISENQARVNYFSDKNLSKADAEAKLQAFIAARKAEGAMQVASVSGREEQLRNAYAEAGFDPGSIPADVGARERAELVKWGNQYRDNGGKDSEPDIAYIMTLDQYSPEAIKDILLDPDRREEFYAKTGGHKSEYAKDLIKKARGLNNGESRALTDTNKGWAADRYAKDDGLVPGSERDDKTINDFATRFEILAKARARDLKLNKADDLPEAERDVIYSRLRAIGVRDGSPVLKQIPLLGRLFQPEQREYIDILRDEEAPIEDYIFDDTPTSAPVAEESPFMRGNDLWAVGHGYTAVETAPDMIPDAVRRVVGDKGNTNMEPVTDADGELLYVKVTENGRVIYYDPQGKVLPKEMIHAGQ